MSHNQVQMQQFSDEQSYPQSNYTHNVYAPNMGAPIMIPIGQNQIQPQVGAKRPEGTDGDYYQGIALGCCCSLIGLSILYGCLDYTKRMKKGTWVGLGIASFLLMMVNFLAAGQQVQQASAN